MPTTQTHVVPIGPCRLFFDGVDLGYTIDGVILTFQRETEEKYVDTSDAPVDIITTKRTFSVTANLAEYSLELLHSMIGASQFVKTIDEDGNTLLSHLAISGNLEGSNVSRAKELHLVPVGMDDNHMVTVRHAIPMCNMEWTYSKDAVRYCSVVFIAVDGENGFVAFGDTDLAFA